MPQFVTLPGTDLTFSRLGLGTANLHRIYSLRQQKRLLHDAYAAGITHFDTAPLYGFGKAEKTLGSALRSNLDATIATKVGLYPPGGTNRSFGVVLARKALGKVSPVLSRPIVDLSIHRAEASLSESLQRLRREYVDLLLLHEPDYSLVDTEEWRRWLETQRSNGRIRAFGVAGRTESVASFCDPPALLASIVQTNDSLVGREADVLIKRGRPLQITYGYLAEARQNRSVFDTAAVVRAALQRNRSGTILLGTTRRERLKEFANALHVAGQECEEERT